LSVIVCDINLGVLNQTISHVGDGFSKIVATAPIDLLGEVFPALCYNLNTYDIKIKGNKEYLSDLIGAIKENEMYTYSANKINIEVI